MFPYCLCCILLITFVKIFTFLYKWKGYSMRLAAMIPRTFDSKPYRSTLKATANALRRFDESEKVNFLFALYGPKLLLRETSPSPDPEDPEEEFMSEDEEIIP